LYQDGLRGNGVFCRIYEPTVKENKQVKDISRQEIDVSASETENRSVTDDDDSGGTSEGSHSETGRGFRVESSKRKNDFDDEGKEDDNEYEGNDFGANTHDDEDDVKPKRNHDARIKASLKNNRRDKTYDDDDGEDEEEVDVSYNKKQSASKNPNIYNNTATGKHAIGKVNDQKNYKSTVKNHLIRRNSKSNSENNVKNNRTRKSNMNKNKHGKRLQSEEDENEDKEEENSEEINEVYNETEEEEEFEPSMTIITGSPKNIVNFLNKGTCSI
jgi:hypothetical protein